LIYSYNAKLNNDLNVSEGSYYKSEANKEKIMVI